MSGVTFEYDLGLHGWSTFRLAIGRQSVDVGPVGYCTDVLGDLVRAALSIATGGVQHKVRCDAEPFEWRILFQRGGLTQLPGPDVKVTVLTFPDISEDAEDAAGKIVFDSSCGVDVWGRAVAAAARAIWDGYGKDGYNAAWMGFEGFPLRALTALESALATDEPHGATL